MSQTGLDSATFLTAIQHFRSAIGQLTAVSVAPMSLRGSSQLPREVSEEHINLKKRINNILWHYFTKSYC